MSRYTVKQLWEERYGKQERVQDYAGRWMFKSACGNPYSNYEPTIDHIRPISCGGKDIKENIVLCNVETNEEKGNDFPHWKTGTGAYRAERKKGKGNAYTIVKER